MPPAVELPLEAESSQSTAEEAQKEFFVRADDAIQSLRPAQPYSQIRRRPYGNAMRGGNTDNSQFQKHGSLACAEYSTNFLIENNPRLGGGSPSRHTPVLV